MKDIKKRLNQLESLLKLVLLASKAQGQFSLKGLDKDEREKQARNNWQFVLKRIAEAVQESERQIQTFNYGGMEFQCITGDEQDG